MGLEPIQPHGYQLLRLTRLQFRQMPVLQSRLLLHNLSSPPVFKPYSTQVADA